MKRAQAYRLIAASQVLDNLSPFGDKLPQNEAQTRELAKLDTATQTRAWRAFLKADLTLGARSLRQFIANHYPNNQPQHTKNSVYQITNEYQKAVTALLDQIKIAQNNQWQLTTKTAALRCNQVMRERILAHDKQ